MGPMEIRAQFEELRDRVGVLEQRIKQLESQGSKSPKKESKEQIDKESKN